MEEMKYPKYLYKFYPLFDSRTESKKRLKTLRDGFFWLSYTWQLNDPTEFNYHLNDQSGLFNMLTSVYRSDHRITCFSAKLLNLPMWSHYTNGYRGFCVKYRVLDPPVNIYKVTYTKRPKPLSELLSDTRGYSVMLEFCDRVNKLVENKVNIDFNEVREFLPPPEDMDEILDMYYKKVLALKSSDWSYEREYRIILPPVVDFTDGDHLLPYEYSFLEPVRFYIGMKCSEQNEADLRQISEDWDLDEAHRMTVSDFYR